MSAPTFSIVIACRNAAPLLAGCLESIRRQSCQDFELVIVDAASSDDTAAIVSRFGDIVSIYVSESDRGIYDAWNKALDRVHGRWICFLGADDRLWDERVLEDFAAFLGNQCGDQQYVYGEVASVDAEGRITKLRGRPWEQARTGFHRSMTVPHVGAMHHHTLFQDARFDHGFRIAGDYDFLRSRLLAKGARFFPRRIARAMDGGVSTHLDLAIATTLELRRIVGRDGHTPTYWYLQFAKTLISVAIRRIIRTFRPKAQNGRG